MYVQKMDSLTEFSAVFLLCPTNQIGGYNIFVCLFVSQVALWDQTRTKCSSQAKKPL